MGPLTEATTQELISELLSRSSSALVVHVPLADPERAVCTSFCGRRLEVVGIASYIHKRVSRWFDEDAWPEDSVDGS